MGGGINHTLKIIYRIFNIKIYKKITTYPFPINNIQTLYIDPLQFAIGKEIVTNPQNLEQKILTLFNGLDKKSKELISKTIDRLKTAYINNTNNVPITDDETITLQKIYKDFYAKIYQLKDDIYYCDGFLIPSKTPEISVMYYKHSMNIFHPKTLNKIQEKDILDIGASWGDSALILQEFTKKNIYSFEASKSRFTTLLRTLKMNNAIRVIPVNKGIGANNENIKINIDSGDSCTKFNHNKTNMENIEIITLDSYIDANNLQIGLIKVDIEGFEMDFLQGAKKTIQSQKPAMILSIYHQASDFFNIKPLIESWNLGYRFSVHKGVDFCVGTETCLYCEVIT